MLEPVERTRDRRRRADLGLDDDEVLSDHGAAAELVEQADLTPDRLVAEIERLGADHGALATLRPTPAPPAAIQERRADRAVELAAQAAMTMNSTAAPVAPLDLPTPVRFHVVGVGGPGMSAIALVLAEMGHTVAAATSASRRCSIGCGRPGVDVHVGHDRALVDGVDAVTASTAIPATNIESAGRGEPGVPCCAAPACWPRSARGPAVVGGGRHARQDHDDVDADA